MTNCTVTPHNLDALLKNHPIDGETSRIVSMSRHVRPVEVTAPKRPPHTVKIYRRRDGGPVVGPKDPYRGLSRKHRIRMQRAKIILAGHRGAVGGPEHLRAVALIDMLNLRALRGVATKPGVAFMART